jgi:ribosome maturation factor RimP
MKRKCLCTSIFNGGLMAKVVDSIGSNIESIVKSHNLEIYDIEYEKEGGKMFLRVFLEKTIEQDVDIDTCVVISREINEFLDNNEINEEEYLLEVSSPGIIRKLKTVDHYKKQIGNKIKLKTFKKIDGFETKEIEVILESVDEKGIVINGKEISYKDITKAETTFEF